MVQQEDAFSRYHPWVNFLYFALVLVFSMSLMHPLCLLISLGTALWYRYTLGGKGSVGKVLAFLLPMMLLASLINPMFNHPGATIIRYLPSGNPLTLASILYGLASAVMLATVILWFSCFQLIICSDKFLYLFGRILPALSLVLAMVLRFVPQFAQQTKQMADAQKGMGRDVGEGTLLHRAKSGITIFSVLITWSLENAIETADSMKSRGYGLPQRSAYSLYQIEGRDQLVLGWFFFLAVFLFSAWSVGGFHFRYFPLCMGLAVTPSTLGFFLGYGALCATPLILNKWEDRKWRTLQSKT